MAIRYDFIRDQFRDDRGRYVSRTSGLKSSIAREQYEAAQQAGAAGRRAQELSVEILSKIAPEAEREAQIIITDLDIRPPETIEETFTIEDETDFGDSYYDELDVAIDDEDQYAEGSTK